VHECTLNRPRIDRASLGTQACIACMDCATLAQPTLAIFRRIAQDKFPFRVLMTAFFRSIYV
jgi:hypothetical protein